jgi:GNAT superfamily N-acetyltransferase
MPLVRVVRTYLELRTRDALRHALSSDPAVRVVLEQSDCIDLFRALYHDVGEVYHWRDRGPLSDEALRAHFASPDVQFWVLHHGSDHAGFFELQRHADASVEIVYFGLHPRFVGRGLGKHLLASAVHAAFAFGADRVWLHTCTLDSPAALPNYIAGGFEPFKVETYEATIDDA